MKNFDTNKLIGALCVAGLVFLFGKWAATSIFTRHEPHEAHGEEVVQAYAIEVAGAEGGAEVAAIDVGALMAAADPAKGEAVFKKCSACHALDKNGTGPHLGDVVNRPVASLADFTYSDGMKAHGGNWTPDALVEFLGNPKAVVKGTKMSFAGISDPQDRANLIAFLTPNFNSADYHASEAPAAEGANAETPAAEAATTEAPAAESIKAETPATEAATTAPAAEAATATLTGDATKGENVFKKCKACHSMEAGKNGTGPSLFGVVGAASGHVADFAYSDAMKNAGLTWDEATLTKYLGDVKGTVPGTKMTFAGLKDAQQRADVIAYLATLK